MFPSCPRCGYDLPTLDGTVPLFCSHCGLPQLRVSADAIASEPAAEGESVAGHTGADGLLLPRALRIVAVAGLVAVVPAALLPGALVSGAVGGLQLLLTPAVTLLVVFLYGRGKPPTVATTTQGTRLGALLGLWVGSLVAALTGIAGFVLRYGYHSHAMDEKIQQAAAAMPAQLRAAGPPPPDLLLFLQTPEFLAGTFIFGHVFTLLLLVAAGSVCGWMAATVLRARRQRSID